MPDHSQRVRDEFTRQAETFSSTPAITKTALTQRIVDALGEDVKGRVLDVACGPGVVSAAVAEFAREVVGVDLTPLMLEKAAQRCAAAGRRNVSFRQGNAAALPLADAGFDAAMTRLSVHHFDQPAQVLAEIFRVLRPGGAFVVADVVASEVAAEAELHNAIEMLRDPSHVRMLPAVELASLVEAAGFAIEARTAWAEQRAFDEWMGIVNVPARAMPLRVVVRTLARAGLSAGIGLSVDADQIRFFHHWILIAARKPTDHRG